MKRNRKIRWGTPVAVKQLHTSFFGTERSLPGEFSLFLLCTLLFFGSACGMLQSMFGWELLSGGMLFPVFFVIVVVSALTEASFLLKIQYRVLAWTGLMGIGAFAWLFYLLRTKQGERILHGLQAVVFEYVGQCNRYFGTSFRVPEGDLFWAEEALAFVLITLCFLLVCYGRIRKRAHIAVTVPFLSMIAGFLVGKTPEGRDMFMGAFALFLSNAAGFRRPEFLAAPDKYGRESGLLKQFLWVPVAVGLLSLCLIVKAAGTVSADERVASGGERIRQKQKEVVEGVIEWNGWQEIKAGKSVENAVNEFLVRVGIKERNNLESNFARLDNETPEYEDVAVLKLAMDKKPEYGAYLVGFYAGRYDDGVWDTDVEAFEEACKKAGFDPETVSGELLSLAPDRVATYYGKASLSDFNYRGIGGTIQYAKANLVKTFLPYFAEVTDVRVRPEGDSRYVKEKGATRVEFTLWNYDVDSLIDIVFRGEETEKAWTKEPWELWYEEYVKETYLEVPEGMTQVEKAAEEIRNWKRNFFGIEGKDSVNFDRLNKAYQVADWMRENTSYNLELPELPKNIDPVEYFLGTSRQGYCMHYASASVMILRELGVPARYVSGYAVGSYRQDGTTKKYEAVVKDSDGHAWVEIYLEGFGWIPVEVTKGYSVLPDGTSIYRQNEGGNYQLVRENWSDDVYPWPGQSHWQETRPFVTPAPTPTPDPTVTQQPSAGGNPHPPTPGEIQSGVSQVGGVDAPDTKAEPDTVKPGDEPEEEKIDLSVNPVVLVFALPAIGIFFGVILPLWERFRKVKSRMDEGVIQKKTKRFGNRQKIKLMNERLYRKLRGKGKIYKRYIRDEEYEEVLQKYRSVVSREERERYMHLVKAAAFSYNTFTEDEVEFCKQIYHKVLYEKRKEEDDE